MKTVLLFLLSFAAHAADISMETGRWYAGLAPDGTFYQSEYQNSNYMHPAYWSIALSDEWKDGSRFGWRVAFIKTGNIQARSNIAVNDETRGSTAGCQLPTSEEGCLIRFDGSGYTFGISTTLTYTYTIKQVNVTGETGLFFFQHHFKSEARFIDCCYRTISYNESSHLWDAPSPVVGITAEYKGMYVTYRHYFPAEHRPLSLTDYSAHQFGVGYKLSFN